MNAPTVPATSSSRPPRRPFPCGARVLIGGGDISGVVEEVVFARGMLHPFYLVEWWQDGAVQGRRFHECDLREAP